MRELLEKLGNEFDDGGGWIRIVDADWLSDELRLSLSIKFDDSYEPELWEITCSDVIEELVCSEFVETLHVSSASPLLKPYLESEVELMFSENRLAPALLLGVLCSSCVEVMGRSEFLSRFINQKATVTGIVSSRYGLLGRFPESVATHILESLKGHPIQVNALPGKTPKRWNGSEHVSYSEIQALQIGSSYVIAGKFSAVRA